MSPVRKRLRAPRLPLESDSESTLLCQGIAGLFAQIPIELGAEAEEMGTGGRPAHRRTNRPSTGRGGLPVDE